VRTRTSETGSEAAARRRNTGFSLLELILVLVVMCLVAAMTFPAMLRGRTAFHLRAVGRDVINSMRYARETAVTEQKVMVVQVNSQEQRLTVSDDVGDGARSFTPPADVKMQGVTDAGDPVSPGPLTIRFFPNGSAETAQIVLQSETGATLKIGMDAITGAARIVPPPGRRTP